MKDIKNYEGLYAVTSCGRIWSYKNNKFLKPQITANGYCQVKLYKNRIGKRFYIHRLVANAYIPNPNNLKTVDHKNNNKHHNYLKNLQWLTQGDNTRKEQCKPIICIETHELFSGVRECAKKMNLDRGNICRVLKGKYTQTGGYTFKYAGGD